jgi:hypothetical protein
MKIKHYTSDIISVNFDFQTPWFLFHFIDLKKYLHGFCEHHDGIFIFLLSPIFPPLFNVIRFLNLFLKDEKYAGKNNMAQWFVCFETQFSSFHH